MLADMQFNAVVEEDQQTVDSLLDNQEIDEANS